MDGNKLVKQYNTIQNTTQQAPKSKHNKNVGGI